MVRYLLILSISVAWLFACESREPELPKSVGLDLTDMDSTVRPQDDFYRYANGGWLRRTSIPEDRGSWGNFIDLHERNNRVMLEVLRDASSDADYIEGTDQRKAADFFAVGMDSLLAERVGASVLNPTFERIAKISNRSSLLDYLVEQELEGGGAFFSFFVMPDQKNSEVMAPYLGSDGLGLPERDYYLKVDEKSKETRGKYVTHIANMLQLIGESPGEAQKNALQSMAIETRLAEATLSKEDRRDPVKQYHKKSIADLKRLVPSIDWVRYFEKLAVAPDSVIVRAPLFMAECQDIIAEGDWDAVRAYLRWMALNGAAPFLNHAIVQESFEFNNRYLRDIGQLRPRWKRVLSITDNYLGEAIGQLYVEKTFPSEAKTEAFKMVTNLKLAMADRIKNLTWMSDSTKSVALGKLQALNVKIGYPDEWKSYAGLVVDNSPEHASYYQNAVNASRYWVRQQLSKLGKPVNKSEWELTPQTVNAYYHPLLNEIVFPAGILQPPYFNFEADAAINYGGIGAVIGHEISHGFDDKGSKYDASGNLNNWWKEADLEQFVARGEALADQFDQYEPIEGVFVQGKFTLGENIGDLGGLNIAYEGLQRHLREEGRPGPIDNFTQEQRFFLSWATIWRAKYKDETLRTTVNTDPHAPDMFRGNGPLTNMQQFYDAFGVGPGDKMFREEEDRIVIW
ncbi:MAG: M13 family metallopeptidase [Cyclobacteriaceae bacterium]